MNCSFGGDEGVWFTSIAGQPFILGLIDVHKSVIYNDHLRPRHLMSWPQEEAGVDRSGRIERLRGLLKNTVRRSVAQPLDIVMHEFFPLCSPR